MHEVISLIINNNYMSRGPQYTAARSSGNYHIRPSRKIIISPGTEETVGVLSKPVCG